MRPYKHTLNLPQTDLPIKIKPQIEVDLIKKWDEDKLYYKILESRDSCPSFTLHDGPPYANGHLHHGHILNKVLKDIVVKSKTMLGYRAEFRPGWDCHGLPIEVEVDKKLGKEKRDMSKLQLRVAYREYANKFVDIQREEFKRLGVLGEWDNPYLTMSSEYEAQTLRELAKFAEANLLYKDFRPVFWCPTHRTALAETEIEYKEIASPSVYCIVRPHGEEEDYIIIWTTTPWTLPGNTGIAVDKEATYIQFGQRMDNQKEFCCTMWVSESRTKQFLKDCSPSYNQHKDGDYKLFPTGKTCKGSDFVGRKYELPIGTDKDEGIIFHSDHVKDDSGTGFVHIAPAHGEDDFRLGKKI